MADGRAAGGAALHDWRRCTAGDRPRPPPAGGWRVHRDRRARGRLRIVSGRLSQPCGDHVVLRRRDGPVAVHRITGRPLDAERQHGGGDLGIWCRIVGSARAGRVVRHAAVGGRSARRRRLSRGSAGSCRTRAARARRRARSDSAGRQPVAAAAVPDRAPVRGPRLPQSCRLRGVAAAARVDGAGAAHIQRDRRGAARPAALRAIERAARLSCAAGRGGTDSRRSALRCRSPQNRSH